MESGRTMTETEHVDSTATCRCLRAAPLPQALTGFRPPYFPFLSVMRKLGFHHYAFADVVLCKDTYMFWTEKTESRLQQGTIEMP